MATSSSAATTDKQQQLYWIERLLRTPIEDFRKYALDLIITPNLIVNMGLTEQQASPIILGWLDKRRESQRLTFNARSRTREKIRQAHHDRIRAMKLSTLERKHKDLYNKIMTTMTTT